MMKCTFRLFIKTFLYLFIMGVGNLSAQLGNDVIVQVSAEVTENPPQIRLYWPAYTVDGAYTIYRRTLGTKTSWGSAVASGLPNTSTQYIDTAVIPGVRYEYRIVRGSLATGYIASGINVPAKERMGKLILLVESSVAPSLVLELARLEKDLVGDGWEVIRRDVSRTESVVNVKAMIVSLYSLDPSNTKTLFLFGHIPVPYSGYAAADGHANHRGAWSSDSFYADMDGVWTDATVNTTESIWTRNHNIPGDGKYDQNVPPTAVELEIGRVDLANMSYYSGGKNEVELLRQYLDKDHAFRHKKMHFKKRSIMHSNFGNWGNTIPGANAYLANSAFFGAGNLTVAAPTNVLRTPANDTYLYAHGDGGGWMGGASGIGNSQLMSQLNPQVAFWTLWGSWFGDWDDTQYNYNFLRQPLVSPYGLTSIWIGQCHWNPHGLAMGDTFGSVMKIFYNNGTDQNIDYTFRFDNRIQTVGCIALMGDPTLKLFPVAPPMQLEVYDVNGRARLHWTASTDTSIVGYYLYKSSSLSGPFQKLTTNLMTATVFYDSVPHSGSSYMARAVKKEVTASGTYFNLSQGIYSEIGSAASNLLPTLSILSPTEGSNIILGDTVEIRIEATDSDGSVTNVCILIDGQKLSDDNMVPFQTHWTPSSGGMKQIRVLAYDDTGSYSERTINVNVLDNYLPERELVHGKVKVVLDSEGILSPGNNKAQIWFLPEKKSKAFIRIVSLSGEKVKLMDCYCEKDVPVSVEWDGSTEAGSFVPSGIYLVKISMSGKEIKTRIMVVQ